MILKILIITFVKSYKNINMNTIVNQFGSTIKHVFQTGTLVILFGTDQTTLNLKFSDEFNTCFLYTGKPFDDFFSKLLKRDLNKFMTFFENKDNFEFNKFDNLLKLKISLRDEYSFSFLKGDNLIYNRPFNLELILNKFDSEEIAGIFFPIPKKLIEKKKYDELKQKYTILKRNDDPSYVYESESDNSDDEDYDDEEDYDSVNECDDDFQESNSNHTQVKPKRGRGRPPKGEQPTTTNKKVKTITNPGI